MPAEKRRLGGAAALFFQRLALAFAALQGAESWFPVPGVSSADPRPGARGLRRDSAGLTGSPKRPWPVLVTGRCSRARTCARFPDGPCGLRWSPLSLVLRPPAPSCSAHKSAAETPGLSPIPPLRPRPAKDNASVQLCALQVAWEQLQRKGRSHFLGGFAKNFHSWCHHHVGTS